LPDAFNHVWFCEISKLKILCNSLIIYCCYPYIFLFLCIFFVFAHLPYHIFLKIDWLFESYDWLWLVGWNQPSNVIGWKHEIALNQSDCMKHRWFQNEYNKYIYGFRLGVSFILHVCLYWRLFLSKVVFLSLSLKFHSWVVRVGWRKVS
jgi:hypothetical protein